MDCAPSAGRVCGIQAMYLLWNALATILMQNVPISVPSSHHPDLSHFLLSSMHVSCCPFSPFPNKHLFSRVYGISLLKTLGKTEISSNEQFPPFPQCFVPFGKLPAIFIKFKIIVCKLLVLSL